MNCYSAWHLGLWHRVYYEGATVCSVLVMPFVLYTGQHILNKSSCIAPMVSVLPDYLTYECMVCDVISLSRSIHDRVQVCG